LLERIDSSGISESDSEWYSYDITLNTSGKIIRIDEIKKGMLPNEGTEQSVILRQAQDDELDTGGQAA